MSRDLEKYQLAERSVVKKFRKQLWNPFIAAVKRYELVLRGDRIAVCISGGKDSMLCAVMMRLLQRISDVPFELTYLAMDPGYSPENRRRIAMNAEILHLPVTFFETNIFEVANKAEHSPCYLCAKMRRGHLYSKAKELGCNKIALGHHFSDVIETTVMSMFYGSQLQGMIPKLHSTNFGGMELIRPLYCVHEDDIIAWSKYNGLEFLRCACRFTEEDRDPEITSGTKRKEIKELIRELKKTNPNIEKSIFNAIHSVHLDTFPGFKTEGVDHTFLEKYDESGEIL